METLQTSAYVVGVFLFLLRLLLCLDRFFQPAVFMLCGVVFPAKRCKVVYMFSADVGIRQMMQFNWAAFISTDAANGGAVLVVMPFNRRPQFRCQIIRIAVVGYAVRRCERLHVLQHTSKQ